MNEKSDVGHSSRVKLRLHVEGRELPLAKVGPDSLWLRQPVAIPASTIGKIVVQIDDSIHSRSVCLFEGASAENGRVRFF
jgi:hypothetical protein